LAQYTGSTNESAADAAQGIGLTAAVSPEIPDGPVTAERLAFAPGVSLGTGLKSAREFLGLTLEDVAAETKVRPAYLTAIEEMAMDRLPSRPFTIGYVRAYAAALGLDESLAIARFRNDAPEERPELPNPIGIDNDSDPRLGVMIVAGLAILAAIIIWNVTQRAMNIRQGPPLSAVARSAVEAPPVTGPVELGEALPPPVEATLPRPYLTPGLEEVDPVAAAAAEALKSARPVARQFSARGAILGAPAAESRVTFQAKGNVVLMLRRGDEPPLEIVTLKDGEAYRAPMTPGVSIDVSMPSSVDYYVDGALRGTLTLPVTPLSQLGGAAPVRAAGEAVVTTSAAPATSQSPGLAPKQ